MAHLVRRAAAHTATEAALIVAEARAVAPTAVAVHTVVAVRAAEARMVAAHAVAVVAAAAADRQMDD